MFQNNAWTGLLFMVGIFWGSYASGMPQVAWGAVAGVITSTLAGVFIGQEDNDGRQGLWGFNGVLVGCAFPTFLADTPLMWIALIFCAILSTWMRTAFNNLLKPYKVSSLTFPFVFLTLVFLLCAGTLEGMPEAGPSIPSTEVMFENGEFAPSFTDLVVIWLKGVAQVFLIDNWVTGIFFLAALAVSSWAAALWAAGASAICVGLSMLYHADPISVSSGLYGFSAVLTGIALGDTFLAKNWKTILWTLAGIVATFFLQAGLNSLMEPFGLPTLTGPFCMATWLFLLPAYRWTRPVFAALDEPESRR